MADKLTIQTPGDDLADTSADDAAPNAAGVTASATDAKSAISAENASVDTAETTEERLARVEAQNAQLQQTTADLLALVRRQVETSTPIVPAKLPTVQEAMAAGHKVPVMTQEGYLVPDSKDWAVSAGTGSK